MKQITVRIQNNYGKELIYPVCEQALIFAKIAGTTTLTMQAIKCIEELGYSIAVEAQRIGA